MNSIEINGIKEFLSLCSAQVQENSKDWEERYKKYAEELILAENLFSDQKQQFRLHKISRYKRISDRDKLVYDLRFAGHSIGTLRISDGKPQIQIKAGSKDFGYTMDENSLNEWYAWESKNAKDFRSYFHKDQTFNYSGSKEAKIQEMLLNEMCVSKRQSNLRDITPVLLDGSFFTMPTPLKASTHSPSYANYRGGGIDILAHVGKGRGSNLCIIELKDEYIKSEPQTDVMRQALIYATFVAYLLRSEIGRTWWNLLGFRGDVRKRLKLYVLTFMPQPQEEVEEIDGDFILDGLEDVTLCCRSVYFNLLEDNKFHFTSNNFKTILCE